MDNMFAEAGKSASTWSITIPQTNGNNISSTASCLYGQTTLVYDAPDSDGAFTLV